MAERTGAKLTHRLLFLICFLDLTVLIPTKIPTLTPQILRSYSWAYPPHPAVMPKGKSTLRYRGVKWTRCSGQAILDTKLS